MAKECILCKYWASYAAIYADEVDDHEIGECHIDGIYPIPSDKCGIHYDDTCCHWER